MVINSLYSALDFCSKLSLVKGHPDVITNDLGDHLGNHGRFEFSSIKEAASSAATHSLAAALKRSDNGSLSLTETPGQTECHRPYRCEAMSPADHYLSA